MGFWKCVSPINEIGIRLLEKKKKKVDRGSLLPMNWTSKIGLEERTREVLAS